jgi:hypothetical protein
MDFLKDIVKEIGGEYTQLASDIDETETYVDTGSYIFNALVSGSIFGGVSGNKITAIAGETSTGKTFFSVLPSLKISLIIILLDIVCILILKQQSLNPFWRVAELTQLAWWLSMSLR